MKKIQIISDNNQKSLKIKSLLLKKLHKNNTNKINTIIVIGGDGFMLQTLKKNKNSNKFFYGINSGSYGFLMNKFSSNNIIKNLSKANMVTISPLEMTVKNNKNQNRKYLAINEVSILRQSRQAASLSINYGSKQIIKKLVSDGVLISTPAGSTAYNLSVHGPILNLNSKKLSISPISPFRPRRWRGKIVSDKSKITIKNLNPKKRPISAVADNIEVRNAKNIIVKTNQKIKFNLLYDKNKSLQKKIKIEQLRRETSWVKKLLGVSGLLFICILSFNEKIAEKYLNYKLSKWVEKKVYFDEFSFDYPNKIIIRGIKIENTNPIFYNNIFISSEISIDIDLKSYLFSQLVIINNLKIYKPSFFLELVEKKNQSQKNSLVSFEDNLGIAKKINENLPDKIWPKKRNDKNFLIKKSLIDKGIVFIKISSINKESKLELSDFEFTNVGNEKGFQHYKDVLKIIFFDFYARERDLEKKKILKNVYKF